MNGDDAPAPQRNDHVPDLEKTHPSTGPEETDLGGGGHQSEWGLQS
jgi:hypothetical protein